MDCDLDPQVVRILVQGRVTGQRTSWEKCPTPCQRRRWGLRHKDPRTTSDHGKIDLAEDIESF